MIFNSQRKMHVVLELDSLELKKLLRGKTLYGSARADTDEPMIMEIYCSEPQGELEDENAD